MGQYVSRVLALQTHSQAQSKCNLPNKVQNVSMLADNEPDLSAWVMPRIAHKVIINFIVFLH